MLFHGTLLILALLTLSRPMCMCCSSPKATKMHEDMIYRAACGQECVMPAAEQRMCRAGSRGRAGLLCFCIRF
jgi:hypothetical protein